MSEFSKTIEKLIKKIKPQNYKQLKLVKYVESVLFHYKAQKYHLQNIISLLSNIDESTYYYIVFELNAYITNTISLIEILDEYVLENDKPYGPRESWYQEFKEFRNLIVHREALKLECGLEFDKIVTLFMGNETLKISGKKTLFMPLNNKTVNWSFESRDLEKYCLEIEQKCIDWSIKKLQLLI